jgi:hypothetical protein
VLERVSRGEVAGNGEIATETEAIGKSPGI